MCGGRRLQTHTLRTLYAHSDAVKAAALSPDTQLMVTASCDGIACLWQVATGQRTASLVGHVDAVKYASFSSSGAFVVTASADAIAHMWRVAAMRRA